MELLGISERRVSDVRKRAGQSQGLHGSPFTGHRSRKHLHALSNHQRGRAEFLSERIAEVVVFSAKNELHVSGHGQGFKVLHIGEGIVADLLDVRQIVLEIHGAESRAVEAAGAHGDHLSGHRHRIDVGGAAHNAGIQLAVRIENIAGKGTAVEIPIVTLSQLHLGRLKAVPVHGGQFGAVGVDADAVAGHTGGELRFGDLRIGEGPVAQTGDAVLHHDLRDGNGVVLAVRESRQRGVPRGDGDARCGVGGVGEVRHVGGLSAFLSGDGQGVGAGDVLVLGQRPGDAASVRAALAGRKSRRSGLAGSFGPVDLIGKHRRWKKRQDHRHGKKNT